MSFSHGLKEKAASVWEEGYRHPFVQGLGAGILDQEIFKFYLLQDYLYLLQYAKVFALGTVKADREEWMRNFTESQYGILATEMNIHREYMTRFGITAEEIEKAKPSLFNQAYTANMLTQGQTGGLAELLAAVFPCAWTYADYGRRLKAEYADRLEGNFYKFWIEGYAGDEFWASFEWFFDAMDELVTGYTVEQKQHIADIFVTSVEFEYLFWDMAYKCQMSF